MFQFKSFPFEEKEIAVKCCESTNKEEYLDSVLTFLYAWLNLNVFLLNDQEEKPRSTKTLFRQYE